MFFSLLMVAIWVLILFAIVIFMTFRYKQRELQHRERMVAMEKGMPLPIENPSMASAAWRPNNYFLRGMVWSLAGFALFIFLLAVSGPHPTSATARVQNANYAKASGASEEQVRMILEDKIQPGLPPGFATIGLIPIGVGLAYLLAYRKEKSLRAKA